MTKPRILVVEDERIVALDIKSQLALLGYEVPATAGWGEEAIRLTEEVSPDLILMDIKLKGDLDGVETAQYIRSHHDVPVIYLTAYADEDTLQRAKVTESYGYLLKPFEEGALRTAIEMALYKHEMERKLRESEQWLSAALNGISDAVLATDAQSRVKFMNPVAQALAGCQESDALGRELGEVLYLVSSDTRAPIPDPAATVLSGKQAFRLPTTAMLVTQDGREILIEGSGSPIRDQLGSITGAVLVLRDITEQVRAHKALAKYAAELETQNEELEAFAHTVAHDIKDPVSTMISYASVLSSDYESLSDKEMKRFCEMLLTLGFKACNIVDELLLLAQVRRSQVDQSRLDMSDIVARAKARLVRMSRERRAQIVLPTAWPTAMGYGPWIEEVWVNYLSNAIKYGGSPPHMEVGATPQQDGMVCFWVRDNGPGIAPEDREQLFAPFTQLRQVRAQGNGLGLSIVRRIVEKLGGQVGLESSLGKGSTFTFTLPGAA